MYEIYFNYIIYRVGLKSGYENYVSGENSRVRLNQNIKTICTIFQLLGAYFSDDE